MASQTPQRPTIANVDAHTRERSPPSPLPFQHIGTIQGHSTNPAVVNPAGTPAFQAVITKLEQMEREATLRRVALEGYAKAVEAFVRNSPDEQKKFAQEIQEGTLAYLNQHLFGTAAAKQPVQNFLRGGPQDPEHINSGRGSRRQNAPPRKNAPPHQNKVGNPESWACRRDALVRDQPSLSGSHYEGRTPDLSQGHPPAVGYPSTSWAVKPNTKAVYDLILKGSNAALILQSHRCTILERVEKWHTYRLAHTPNVLTGLLGNRLVTADVVTEEAEIQTGCNNCGAAISKHQGASGAAVRPRPNALVVHGPFPAGHKHCAAALQRGLMAKIVPAHCKPARRDPSSTNGYTQSVRASGQEPAGTRPKSGVQVVIPTPGARIAAYEAADQQSRRVKRKTAPTGSLNLVELSKRSVYAVSDDEASPTLSQRRNGDDRDIVWLELDTTWTAVRTTFTLVTLLPGRGQGADGNAGYRVTEANLPRFAHAINSGISHLPQPADVLDTRDLDDIAALLTTLFQNAIKAVGKRPQGTAKSAPWWTPACAELHAGYASARRRAAPEQERKRRDMLSTIRNAKRDYWRRVIDSAADDADLYKVVGWHKLAPSLKAPPLIVNGVSIESTKEKSEALLEKVLHRYDDSDDLEYDPLEGGRSATDTAVDHGYLARGGGKECDRRIKHFPRGGSPQHGGALPKRSAVDLVASFVYDVESAFAQGKEVTLVTLDVQGAFDALLPRRLLERMRKQGWPGKLLRLIGSFLADRKVMVRLEGTYTAESKTQCGTPQGSPLSPILYVLYLAELLNQDRSLRFGYADDIAIYRASKSVESNVTMLKRDVRQVMRWGAENKVAFAPEKLEMIHLSRKRNTNAPSIRVSPELTITPVTAVGDEQPALRWLGVWIDRKLSFKRHVAERSTKALKVARHIKGLAGVRFGPPAASLRKAVVTCVQSSLLYGSEVWYGGRRKPSASHGYNRNRLVSTRLGPLIEKTNKVMVLAARGVLPAWRTAPTASVLRDAGLPSGSTALEHARIRFRAPAQDVRRRPPTGAPARNPILPWQRATKLRCADTLIPYAPRPVLAQPHFSPGCRTDPTEGSTKEAAAEQFNTWWSQLSDNTITVFSDGSEQYKDGAKLVGYGYAIYRGQSLVRTGSGAINSISHVFDAEAIGALKGLQCALEILRALG
ncbi:hypothetical protein DID88_002332 [Monilinia fructigena]|uniref:Reverse transcriptase domain-containing protein n=1 Tax=Monilinia fructigena TaxID=38457 RepID=A0A395IDB6_9HELO|nr:hypothetical protein DID88_002332 [Monilinia fructigena]